MQEIRQYFRAMNSDVEALVVAEAERVQPVHAASAPVAANEHPMSRSADGGR